jgi:hypothetical protein
MGTKTRGETNMKEKPLDYFLRMLIEEKLYFVDLIRIYVAYLEEKNQENRKDITESSLIIAMYKNPKLNQGTKKQLEERATKLIEKIGIFPKEKLI